MASNLIRHKIFKVKYNLDYVDYVSVNPTLNKVSYRIVSYRMYALTHVKLNRIEVELLPFYSTAVIE